MENCRKKSISYSEQKHSITPGLSALSYNNARCNVNRTDLKKILFKTPNSKKNVLCLSAKKKQTPGGLTNDRYIPSRVVSNMEIGYHLLHSNSQDEADRENQVDHVKKKLISDTCNGLPDKPRVLNLHNKFDNDEKPTLYLNSLVNSVKKNTKRYISLTPERILDAPEFRNDYYLNLIDWSSQNNLAVALDTDMYIWNEPSGEISQLFSMDREGEYISSTAWQPNKGNILAVGSSKNVVELWDVNAQRCLRVMSSQKSRIGALAWNNFILTSGSRSGEIHHHDVRVAHHHVGTLRMHEQEVCGLKWNSNGRHLASGGNDNLAIVWDSNCSTETSQPLHVFTEHTAAVKALAWCPWQSNLLATGGGTSDGHIKLWNANSGNLIQSIDSKSQISCLLWSKYYKELISSHGYSTNQLTVWRYPDMTPMADLLGHQNRVLMMAMSADGEMVASVGADETIRLWKCFTVDDKIKKSKDSTIVKNQSYTSLSRCIR